MPTIASIVGFEILDSRGHPTVAVRVGLDTGVSAMASVPSGASTGAYEAVEKRSVSFANHGYLIREWNI